MNDDELNELLGPLRAQEPTGEMRAANRGVALGVVPVTPWWRRTVEVPLPVALATAAGLVIAVTMAARSAAVKSDVSDTHKVVATEASSIPKKTRDNSTGWSVSQSYVGFLESRGSSPHASFPTARGSS